jgi:hypothetical protein
VNEQLQVRLGEYLIDRGVDFDRVTDVELDPDGGSLDIWYVKPNGLRGVREMRDVEGFLTFLVTGGK